MRKLSAIIGIVFCAVMSLSLAACGTNAASSKGSEGASSSVEAVSSSSAETASSSGSRSISSSDSGSVSSSDSGSASQSSANASDAAKTKVYFAAPLFSQSEKDYNLELTKVLEDHGYQVFLPQRDGFLYTELEGKTEEERTRVIFEKDRDEVLNADVLLFLLDGRVPDEGACVELGIAYANGKRCYGVKTDVRSEEIDMDLNPMIAGCFTKLFKDYDGEKPIEELEQYLSENKL